MSMTMIYALSFTNIGSSIYNDQRAVSMAACVCVCVRARVRLCALWVQRVCVGCLPAWACLWAEELEVYQTFCFSVNSEIRNSAACAVRVTG